MGEAMYPVPEQWARDTLIDETRYDQLYRRSLDDPEGFWRDEARRIDWMRPFTRVRNQLP